MAEEKKDDPSMGQEVSELITEAKQLIEVAEVKDKDTNVSKLEAYWKIGKRMNDLADRLSDKDMKAVLARVSEETGMSNAFYYLSRQFSSTFTEDQYKKSVANGLRVKVMKAIVQGKFSADQRSRLIQRACTSGLRDDEIRQISGTKGSRTAANASKRAKEAKKQPPRRLFTTALDRVLLLEESVGYATEAVGRMADMSEKDLAEATKILTQLRDKALNLSVALNQFSKFTQHVGNKKGSK